MWPDDPPCGLFVLVRCPGLAVDKRRATCDSGCIPPHGFANWASRTPVQAYSRHESERTASGAELTIHYAGSSKDSAPALGTRSAAGANRLELSRRPGMCVYVPGRARPRSPRRAAPRPHAPRLRARRSDRSYQSNPKTRTFAETLAPFTPLADCQEA
jgi:hypothetical protein